MKGKETLELLRSRQSDRSYNDRGIEKEKLERILEAGRISPSACNSQPWRFIVVDDPEKRREVALASSARTLGFNRFTDQVPLFIVIIRERSNPVARVGGKIKDKDYSLIDVGIAAGSICIQAAAEGLGSCMLGWFDEERVKNILDVPSNKRAELIITIGYSNQPLRDKKRKDVNEVVGYNKY